MVFYFGSYTFHTEQKHYSTHTTVTAEMVDSSGRAIARGKTFGTIGHGNGGGINPQSWTQSETQSRASGRRSRWS